MLLVTTRPRCAKARYSTVWTAFFIFVLAASGLFGAFGPAGVRPAAAESLAYFAPTGHSVVGRFLATYNRLGGLDRFGYPRTEEIEVAGRRVQFFQRAVLEYFPEHQGTGFEVQLWLLGDLLTSDRRGGTEWLSVSGAPDGSRYFAETRHSISGAFLGYFNSAGGLDSFGYPVSEEYTDSGNGTRVQYFQRARLEAHPSNPPGYQVQLGLLGDELLAREWSKADPRLVAVAAPAAPPEYEWGRGTISVSSTGAGRYNAKIAVDRLDGAILTPGQRLNFDDVARSWDGHEDLAYLVSRGTSCTGGLVTMRGGGVCYVSTAIWRAWMRAGLKTVERVSHSGLLDDFGAGFDAANTLIVENDSPTTLRLGVRFVGDEILVTITGSEAPDRRSTVSTPVQRGNGYVVVQDVQAADGRRWSASFDSHYCW